MKEEKLHSSFTTNMLKFVDELEKETTFCSHCGRVLTDPQSIKRKIGPICDSRAVELAEIEK